MFGTSNTPKLLLREGGSASLGHLDRLEVPTTIRLNGRPGARVHTRAPVSLLRLRRAHSLHCLRKVAGHYRDPAPRGKVEFLI